MKNEKTNCKDESSDVLIDVDRPDLGTGLKFTALMVALVTITMTSHAVIMLPLSGLSPTGTSVAQRRQLGGTVLADSNRRFAVTTSAGDVVSGYLQDRVIRSTEMGTLVFDQRVVMDAVSSPSASVSMWRRSGMTIVTTDVEFRRDGLGSLGARSIQRSNTGAEINFEMPRGVNPGESTYFHSVMTNAVNFDELGSTTLIIPGAGVISLRSYQPAGTPQPYYTVTPLKYANRFAFINDYGQISTTANDSTNAEAVLWQPTIANGIEGALNTIPKLPGFAFSEGNRINNRGQIVGTAHSVANLNKNDSYTRAFLWSPAAPRSTTTGGLLNLGVLPGGTRSGAWGINEAGEISGSGDYPGAEIAANGLTSGRPLLWLDNTPHVINDATYGVGYSINNNSTVCGYGDFVEGTHQSFIWTQTIWGEAIGSNLAISRDNPRYAGPGVAFDINDHNVAVGIAQYNFQTAGEPRGVIWSQSTFKDLGKDQIPNAINNAGVVVGTWTGGLATIYRNEVRSLLSNFVSQAQGWNLFMAYDVNESEQITGVGWSPLTDRALVLLTPVRIHSAEPSPRKMATSYMMKVEGTGFVLGARALLNGVALTTTRVDSNHLIVVVPESLLRPVGALSLLVINPDGTTSTVKLL